MRVALVTGAAGGIGGATVTRLLRDEYAVIALDIHADGEALAAEYVVPVVADVGNRAALDAAVAGAVDRFSRLDVAAAAAAVIVGGQPPWETDVTELDEPLAVDTGGVWNTAAAVVPAMLAGPDPSGCRFVAVASAAGHHGMFGLTAYNVAKHGVVGLVKGLAADLVGSGVSAVAVSPGATRTPMLDATADINGLPDTEPLVARQFLQRVLESEELAAAVAFCCSRKGAVLNGSVVHADGGFS